MTQHRSISQRLQKAKSKESKQITALDWAANWQSEYSGLIYHLEQAIKNDNYDEFCIATGQLKAIGLKRFTGLQSVIKLLSD